MASISAAPPRTPEALSFRERLKKIRRTDVLSVLAVVFGLFFVASAFNFAPEAMTGLTFGAGLPRLDVQVQPYLFAVGMLFVGLPLLGYLPPLARLHNLLLGIVGILIIPTVLIVAAADTTTNVTVLLAVSIRLATPIVLGAMAGIWCERSGVSNIAIEGMMLTGACFGFTAFTLTVSLLPTGQAQFVGLLAAVASGGLMSLLLAWLAITFRTNQIVAGTVINILAVGLTSFIRREVLFSSEAGRETLQPVPIPGLSQIPIIGDILFTGRPIFYMMFIILILTHVILFYTRWGLRTRAVGENPRAADTLGINVLRNRWINVLIGGLIAGLAGAWFSLETNGSFEDNMTSGRGFIALAAVIFGKWLPFGAFGGALLFGFSDALGQRFQIVGVDIPAQFLQMVPYFITIVVLAGLVGRAVAPRAAGVPYEKEGK
jgi:simple sugar transport system permease protein